MSAYEAHQEIDRLRAENAALLAERDELQAIFDAQHKAEMRGIAAWRAEDPEERDLTMPSTERFTVWLLNERMRLMAALYDKRLTAVSEVAQRARADALEEAALIAFQFAANCRASIEGQSLGSGHATSWKAVAADQVAQAIRERVDALAPRAPQEETC